MNIKYRLMCKRLMEERKKVGVIQYYNVLFIMELMTHKDIWYMEQLSNGIDRMYMKDIHEWCRLHSIEYQTVFVYRKEYPLGQIYGIHILIFAGRWKNIWEQR